MKCGIFVLCCAIKGHEDRLAAKDTELSSNIASRGDLQARD